MFDSKKSAFLMTGLAAILILSMFVALYHPVGGVSANADFLNVSVAGPAKLGVNEAGTYTASVNNSYSGKCSFTWSISPVDNNTVLVSFGNKCNLTFVTATDAPYCLSVQARDSMVGNIGSGSIAVYDPYTSPNLYLGVYGAPYSYLIETDGAGWYRAINGATGQIAFTSTNASSILNSVMAIADNKEIFIKNGVYTLTNTIVLTDHYGFTIRGESRDGVIFRASPTWTANQSMFDSANATPILNCTLESFTLDGAGKNAYLLHFHAASGRESTVRDIRFENTVGAGSYAIGAGGDNLVIENNIFENVWYGMYLDTSNNVKVLNNVLRNIASKAILSYGISSPEIRGNYIDTYSGDYAIEVSGGGAYNYSAIVENNHIFNGVGGIAISVMYGGSISNNLIQTMSAIPIYTDRYSEGQISNNFISGHTSTAGIQLNGGYGDVVEKNHVWNGTTGIEIQGGSSLATISFNDIRSQSTADIYLGGTVNSDNNQILSNTLTNSPIGLWFVTTVSLTQTVVQANRIQYCTTGIDHYGYGTVNSITFAYNQYLGCGTNRSALFTTANSQAIGEAALPSP